MQEYGQRFARENPPELWQEPDVNESTACTGTGILLNIQDSILRISKHTSKFVKNTPLYVSLPILSSFFFFFFTIYTSFITIPY